MCTPTAASLFTGATLLSPPPVRTGCLDDAVNLHKDSENTPVKESGVAQGGTPVWHATRQAQPGEWEMGS